MLLFSVQSAPLDSMYTEMFRRIVRSKCTSFSLPVISPYTLKDEYLISVFCLCDMRAFLQAFRRSRRFSLRSASGSGGHCQSVLQADGKTRTDKAAFRKEYQLGIHRGMSQFHRNESKSHESEAIHV